MNKYQQWAKSVEDVAAIIKRKFTNLTVEETLKMSHEIVEVVLLDNVDEVPF